MNRIKQARKEKGLSLRDVARMAGISASMLSEMERGNRRIIKDGIVKKDLAYILGMTISELDNESRKQHLLAWLEKNCNDMNDDFILEIISKFINNRNKPHNNAHED